MDTTGHRTRLKARFLRAAPNTFSDYEILELLLFNAVPRKDVKPMAKEMLRQFGSLGNVINATPAKLSLISGAGPSVAGLLKLVKETVAMVNKEQIAERPLLNSTPRMLEYLRANIGYRSTECLLALYLNHKQLLIAEELRDYGTVNSVSIYPREILKAALYHDASSVILAHNHPSGATQPSELDFKLTKALQNTLKAADISLADHIIVSSSNSFSFKANNLI